MEPENIEVKQESYLHQVTPLSKYLAMALFIAMPFVGGWIGYMYSSKKVVEVDRIVVENVPVQLGIEVSSGQNYKKTFLGGEVPANWSELSVSESIVQKGEPLLFTNLRYSIAPYAIEFGDGAWSQIDFYYLAEGVSDEIINDASQWEGTQISSSTLGGRSSLVIQYPIDNGEVTKAGTGGTDYIIEISVEDQSRYPGQPTHLLIRKWARGDEMFEKDFQHYLETTDLSSSFNN